MPRLAIIGGGFAGAVLALRLLKSGSTPLEVLLCERRPPLGRGLAYATPLAAQRLNVPAEEMSVWEEVPLDFVAWLQQAAPTALAERFVARGLYGQYVEDRLLAAVAAAPVGRTLSVLPHEVIGLLPEAGGFALRLANGERCLVERVVLAIGSGPPAPLRACEEVATDPRYVADPWSVAALAPLPAGAQALIVGAGLTAVDLGIALLDQAGAARVTLISRRARLPLPAYAGPAVPVESWFTPGLAPAALLACCRAAVAHGGVDWRLTLDDIKPHVPALWAGWSLVERRRFLRHLRPVWEAHRNRLPPPTAARAAELLAEGRLVVRPARLAGVSATPGALLARLRPAAGPEELLSIARVLNCTGGDLAYRRAAPRVVQDLIGTGLARLEPLGLGLDVTADFRLLDEDGVPTPGLFALGAPTKGRFWEVAAVPALREQAAALAHVLEED